MRFFCHISFLQFSGELYSHLVLYFITIGFADYTNAVKRVDNFKYFIMLSGYSFAKIYKKSGLLPYS